MLRAHSQPLCCCGGGSAWCGTNAISGGSITCLVCPELLFENFWFHISARCLQFDPRVKSLARGCRLFAADIIYEMKSTCSLACKVLL